MSMIINLVEDHNIYLCEGGPVYNGGVQPTPVTYLTQWKIVGNSEVHGVGNLTSWKVSGNSQVHTLPYPDGVVLPNGYKRCKYLEFHGTEYINSGVLTKNDIGFRCQYSSINANESVFGAQSSSSDLFLFLLYTTNSVKTGYGGAASVVNINTNPIDGNRHTLILDSEQCKIDNEFVGVTRRTASLFYNVYIGTHNQAGRADSRMFIGKIYEFKLYDSNSNLFDGIPCLDDNNIPCLYDTVSGTSFYNNGTGTFGYEIEPQPTEIWSCGDLGQDGKYHVKISNGVDVYDIALDEPLRKVNDVADTIEFPSGTEGKALVTRKIMSGILGEYTWSTLNNRLKTTDIAGMIAAPSRNNLAADIICATYPTVSTNQSHLEQDSNIAVALSGNLFVYDTKYPDITTEAIRNQLIAKIQDMEVIFRLATPTTELIDVSPFPVSPTDTYTSANDTPYSAFQHTENKEIWSCGEYNATDGKYHILVQPLGGSIADIALNAPLRKVNNIAETIIYPYSSSQSNYAIISVLFISVSIDKLIADRIITDRTTGLPVYCKTTFKCSNIGKNYPSITQADILCNKIKNVLSVIDAPNHNGEFIMVSGRTICVRNTAIEQTVEAYQSYFDSLGAIEIIWPVNTPGNGGVKVSQIEEADSYTCVISQGGKAVSWSSFETNSE